MGLVYLAYIYQKKSTNCRQNIKFGTSALTSLFACGLLQAARMFIISSSQWVLWKLYTSISDLLGGEAQKTHFGLMLVLAPPPKPSKTTNFPKWIGNWCCDQNVKIFMALLRIVIGAVLWYPRKCRVLTAHSFQSIDHSPLRDSTATWISLRPR